MHQPTPRGYRRGLSLFASAALVSLAVSPGMVAPTSAAPTSSAPAAPAGADDASTGYTWSNAQIEGGGYVPGIVYNPTEEGLVYARTDIGGAYRLDRDSDRWIPLLDHVGWEDWSHNGVLSLASDPVEPNRVYAAVGMYTVDWDPNNGAILRSDDYGETWEKTELPFKVGGNMPGRGIGERLQVDPADNDILYYGAEGDHGLWRSTDKGATWSQISSFPNTGAFAPDPDSDYVLDQQELGVLWTAFDPRSATAGEGTSTLFTAVADTENPLYRSDDGGRTWTPVDGAPTGFLPHKGRIDEDGTLYLTTSDTAGPYDGADGQVWRYSIDDGTWDDITPEYRPVGEDFGFSGLTIDANDPDTIMVTTQTQWWPDILIFRSTDRGETWSPIWEYGTDDDGDATFERRYEQDISGVPWLTFGVEPTEPAVSTEPSPKLGWMTESLEINPFDPDEAMYGTGATIYRTQNLTDWDRDGGRVLLTPSAQGIEETAIQDLAAPAGEVDLVSAMYDLGGFVHDDIDEVPGMIEDPYLGDASSVDIAGLDQDIFVRAGIDGEGIARIATSRDAGATWSAGASIEGAEEPGVVTVTADGGAAVWSAPGIGVQVSTDDGQTWEQASGIDGFARVEADRVDPQLVHAWSDGAMYTSTDGGLTFAQTAGADATTVLPGGGEMNLTTVPGVAGEVWAAGGDTEGDGDGVYGLFRSTDGGNSWEELAGFDAADVVGFGAAAPGRDRPTIFTSAQRDGERGIFRSVDGGETWQRINDDQHQWGVTNAAITGDPDEFGRVYIATNGRGIIVGDTEQLPTDGGDGDDRPGNGDDDSGNGTAPGDESGEGGTDPVPQPGGDTSDSGTDDSAGEAPAGGADGSVDDSTDGTSAQGTSPQGDPGQADEAGTDSTPRGTLARTGTDLGIAALLAGTLTAAGGALLLIRRRLRR